MSQENVERLLGRMLTDNDFLLACRHCLEKTCLAEGLPVTSIELSALEKSDLMKLASLSSVLDDRLKRAARGFLENDLKSFEIKAWQDSS